MGTPLERPDTSNYFRFYGLKEAFDIDEYVLKNLYLEKSKLYHPDFYGNDPQSQNIAIAASSYNNLAYKTLGSDIRRAGYLVDLKLDKEAENNAVLPQDFLMEMMDLNEAVDEANEENKTSLFNEIAAYKQENLRYISEKAREEDWSNAQMGILKWKYLERLEQRLR